MLTVQRVLQVHTRYRQAGGEDQVVAAERTLLEDAGVVVDQVIFDNAELQEARSTRGDLRLAVQAVWSEASRRRVAAAIGARRPDVVHVHNTFAAASPSVYAAASSAGVALVQSLHNYRFVCPAATDFRDGRPCTDCVGLLAPLPGIVHACVRGSRAQSVVAATTLTVHRALGTFRRGIDLYLAGTPFQRDLMVRGGLPRRKIMLVPNFLEPDPGAGGDGRDGILFVGRLAEEKGIDTVIGAATLQRGRLTVVGDGPLVPSVRAAADAGHLAFLGPLWADEMRARLRAASALVMPSIWFEGFPMIVLEAFAAGTPVLASRVGTLPDIVEDGVTGRLFPAGDSRALAQLIEWAAGNPTELRAMGRAARQAYEARYRGPRHLELLGEAYARAQGAREALRA